MKRSKSEETESLIVKRTFDQPTRKKMMPAKWRDDISSSIMTLPRHTENSREKIHTYPITSSSVIQGLKAETKYALANLKSHQKVSRQRPGLRQPQHCSMVIPSVKPRDTMHTILQHSTRFKDVPA